MARALRKGVRGHNPVLADGHTPHQPHAQSSNLYLFIVGECESPLLLLRYQYKVEAKATPLVFLVYLTPCTSPLPLYKHLCSRYRPTLVRRNAHKVQHHR